MKKKLSKTEYLYIDLIVDFYDLASYMTLVVDNYDLTSLITLLVEYHDLTFKMNLYLLPITILSEYYHNWMEQKGMTKRN